MSITKIFNRSTLTVGAASLVGVAALLGANPAQASGFTGSYDPSNWDFTNSNADGFVNTTNAPSSISLTGGNNGSGSGGQTSYETTSAGTGLVSFNWNYTTNDGPFWDPFGFILNGDFTQLSANNGGSPQSNTFSTTVNEGDIFGFAIKTVDNIVGAASVTVSDFHAPESEPESVPEPASILGLMTVGALGVGSALKRRKKQAA